MLTDINPKLKMRDKTVTREFYVVMEKDRIQIHFFVFKLLDHMEI